MKIIQLLNYINKCTSIIDYGFICKLFIIVIIFKFTSSDVFFLKVQISYMHYWNTTYPKSCIVSCWLYHIKVVCVRICLFLFPKTNIVLLQKVCFLNTQSLHLDEMELFYLESAWTFLLSLLWTYQIKLLDPMRWSMLIANRSVNLEYNCNFHYHNY